MEGVAWQSSGEDSTLPLQEGTGSVSGQGTKIPQAVCHSQNEIRPNDRRY